MSSDQVNFNKATHVIFDVDGTILDTEILYTQATHNIVKNYGKTYDWKIKSQLMGLPGVESAKQVVELLNLPITWETYYELSVEQYKLLMPDCQVMPGAEKLIRHLHKKSIPIAIATSSSEETFNLKISNKTELFDLFLHKVLGDDKMVKEGKPAPDIFLVCASRFSDKPKPSKCLVIEDSPNGITAAIRAGMQCIMIPDEHISPEETKEATQVIKSLEHIKLEQFGLPPYED